MKTVKEKGMRLIPSATFLEISQEGEVYDVAITTPWGVIAAKGTNKVIRDVLDAFAEKKHSFNAFIPEGEDTFWVIPIEEPLVTDGAYIYERGNGEIVAIFRRELIFLALGDE